MPLSRLNGMRSAAGACSKKMNRKTQQQVPWPQIIKMRHVLVHDYLGIDLAEVWAVVERDLPTLKKHVGHMLKPVTKRRPQN